MGTKIISRGCQWAENSVKLTLPRWLLLRIYWVSILRTGTHPRIHIAIHGWLRLMALLRPLTHHHRSTSSRAWITIDTRHCGWMAILQWHEMWASLRIHNLRTWRHALRGHEAICRILYHDGSHLLLLRHKLMALRL